MQFRQAQVSDIPAILIINQQFLKKNLTTDENGFLLGERTAEFVEVNLGRYFVARDTNQVYGYVEVDYTITPDNFTTGQWETKGLKEYVQSHINNKKYIYVIQIAVKEQRKGVGKFIIEQLAHRYSASILISFVAKTPDFNKVSLDFHLTAGFQQVGIFIMKSKFGIADYNRICLIRRPSRGSKW